MESHVDENVQVIQSTLRLLAYGGERPSIAFGSCPVGSKRHALLKLLNETDLDRILTLEKGPPPDISLLYENETNPDSISVPRRSKRALHITWQPSGAAVLHDALRWRMSEGVRQARLEVRIQGVTVVADVGPVSAGGKRAGGPTAVKSTDVRGSARSSAAPPPRTLSLARPPLSAALAVQMNTNKGQEVQRHVTLPSAAMTPVAALESSKPPSTPPAASPQAWSNGPRVCSSGARHVAITPPRVSSTADPHLALDFRRVGCVESKREHALISWMNSEVAPLGAGASDAESSVVEEHAVRRLVGEVTGKAWLYFKRDEGFAATASKIESKIATKQLVIREPAHVFSDVRMRQQALEVLTSYHPFWLAIGLQTVLGRALVFSHGNMMSMMRPGGEVPAFLRTHILEHLLADPDLAARYRQASSKHDYWDALAPRVLGRVLLLVFLLDRMAQRSDLPAGTPSLFRQDAAIKSSEQVIQEFLRPRLAGAGDLRYSLRMMSYSTEYVQHARDEADFLVRKPLDLRDGTRLAKLVDNLKRQASVNASNGPQSTPAAQPGSSSTDVSRSTGVPTAAGSSRNLSPDADLLPSMAFPQNTGKPMDESQMRNNCLRLVRALQQRGISLQGLIYAAPAGLMSADAVAKSVAEGLLRVDQRVVLGLLWQIAMHYKLRRHVDVRSLEREAARLRRAAAETTPSGPEQAAAEAGVPNCTPSLYLRDQLSEALLQWMRAACLPYGIHIRDFTWSLSDGRALCYLIHAYMPEALPRETILSPEPPSSTDAMARLTGGTEYVKLDVLKERGWSAVYEMGGAIHDDTLAAAFKRSVEANFAAAHAAGEALGVPAMLTADDYTNDGPDELAAILYVGLLSEALLKLTAERRAAHVIMEFLRRRLRWRPGYMRAALQRYRFIMRQNDAAVAIQAFWRMKRQRSRYLALRQAACVLQAFSRGWLVDMRIRRRTTAAVVLQAAWRGHAVRKKLQEERCAAARIAAAWRGYNARKAYLQLLKATRVIQLNFRRYISCTRHAHKRQAALEVHAAVRIQAWWRGLVARGRFNQLRSAAIVLQAVVRGHLGRQQLLQYRRAAIIVQAAWRGYVARRQCLRVRGAVAVLHRTLVPIFRARMELARRREEHQARVQAVIVVQTWVRTWLARRRFYQSLSAVRRIQAWWRMAFLRRQHNILCSAAVTFQAAFRRWQVQHRLRAQHHAAKVIQRFWRWRAAVKARQAAHEAAMRVLRWTRAATTIAAFWRMVVLRRHYFRSRHAAITLQASVRCLLAMRQMERTRTAANIVQGVWRCVVAKREMAKRAEFFYCNQLRLQEERLRQTVRNYMARLVAAKRIQAWWRGHLARKEVIPLLKERRKLARQQRAAVVIQSAWRGYTTRQQYLRVRRAVETLDRTLVPIFRARKELARLRSEHMARVQAATTVQTWVRMWLARRRFLQSVSAARRMQAAWRGHVVRLRSGMAERMARQRLAVAAAEARTATNLHIGNRTRAALETARQHKNLGQVLEAAKVMEMTTRYSRDCCQLIVQQGGVGFLLRVIRSCNRSKPYPEAVLRILEVLKNICRYDVLVGAVFRTEECLAILSDRLQLVRESEGEFMNTTDLLHRLITFGELCAEIESSVLKQWEGIQQVLIRKAEMERKYLERLEGQKGSDVSAQESARKLVILQQQVQALEVLISRAREAPKDHDGPASDAVCDQEKYTGRRVGKAGIVGPVTTTQNILPQLPGFKNTLVKGVVSRMSQSHTGTRRNGGSATAPRKPG